jgi:hypothetical protein
MQINDLPLEELASNSQHCCCALGNIVVTRSLVPPDGPYLKDWVAAILRYGQAQPRGIGLVVLIDADAPPPNEPARVGIKEAYVTVGSVVRGAVQVFEGEGFAAAAKRSVMTIINMATAIGFPIRVTGTVPEATKVLHKLLAPVLTPSVDLAALSRIAELMRERQKKR